MPSGSNVCPRRDAQHVSHILFCLDTICNSHPDSGDFNHLKDKYIKGFPLKQIVKAPTQVSSIIDCVYTNFSNYSDVPKLSQAWDYHYMIVHCTPHKVVPNKCTATLIHGINIHNAKSAFVASLKKVRWLPLYRMTSCQDMFNYFNYQIQLLLNKHLSYRSITKYQTDKPWVNRRVQTINNSMSSIL